MLCCSLVFTAKSSAIPVLLVEHDEISIRELGRAGNRTVNVTLGLVREASQGGWSGRPVREAGQRGWSERLVREAGQRG